MSVNHFLFYFLKKLFFIVREKKKIDCVLVVIVIWKWSLIGKYRSVDLFGVAEENCVSVAADVLLLGLLLKVPLSVICSQKRMIFCVA